LAIIIWLERAFGLPTGAEAAGHERGGKTSHRAPAKRPRRAPQPRVSLGKCRGRRARHA
jgi:hypothetical protein